MHSLTEQIDTNSLSRTLAAPIANSTTPQISANSNGAKLFSSLLDTNNQSTEIQSIIRQLSTQLPQQLHSDSDISNSALSLTGSAITDIYLKDSNQDGELNVGDSLVAILTNKAGDSTEIRIPLNENDILSLSQSINDSVESEFIETFIQSFIEMMMTNLYQAGEDLQNFLEKSQENYSYEVSV